MTKAIKGYLLLSGSVLSFSLMVIVSKYICTSSAIPAAEITFVRFLVSFGIIVFIKFAFKKNTDTQNLKYLLDRGISNFVAVYLFFLAISLLPATKANLYNMTYPIFVGIIAHFINNEKFKISSIITTLICFAGVWLVVNPSRTGQLGSGDLIGIASGITAGYAIVSLKRASKNDSAFTILYYHMGIGLILSFLLSLYNFVIPTNTTLVFLLFMSVLSLAGQYFITAAYKYVSSVQGAIWSSARIFVVGLFGIIFLGDHFDRTLLPGAILIIVSIILANMNWQNLPHLKGEKDNASR